MKVNFLLRMESVGPSCQSVAQRVQALSLVRKTAVHIPKICQAKLHQDSWFCLQLYAHCTYSPEPPGQVLAWQVQTNDDTFPLSKFLFSI
jgi:hypothetical protein